jgi:hypothetical protein
VADVVPDGDVLEVEVPDDTAVGVVVDAPVEELGPADWVPRLVDDGAAVVAELMADWTARVPTMPVNATAASPVVTRRARAAG